MAVETADWLVLTSARGVRETADLLEDALPRRVRIAAVGPATAAAVEKRFGRINWVCHRGTGEALARDLAGLFALEYESGAQRVVVAAADRARRHLEEVLEQYDHEVVRVPVYRTVAAAPREPRRDLAADGVDVILLASPSAVEGLLNQAVVHEQARIVTIGPVTSDAVRAAGLTVAAEAARPSLEGLLEVIP
jgi:uroporphyrinogen-III synthase